MMPIRVQLIAFGRIFGSMNLPLIIANSLLVFAFFVHTIQGDLELRMFQPDRSDVNRLEKWVQLRAGWHWVSIDLLLGGILLGICNFTDWLEIPQALILLKCLAGYYFLYGMIWFAVVLFSPHFPKRLIKLGQWFLLVLIAGLIYWGIHLFWFKMKS